MVEASIFGAEFIAACTCLEAVEGLQFKLRMFGIPVEGPTNVMCDNNSVVNKFTKHPDSISSKKFAIIMPVRQWRMGLHEWERLNLPATWQIFLQRLC